MLPESSFFSVTEPKNEQELRKLVKKLALDLRAYMAYEAASKPLYEKYQKQIEELQLQEKNLKSEIKAISKRNAAQSSKTETKISEDEIKDYQMQIVEKEEELRSLLKQRKKLMQELSK
ncbi:hypothetical protein TVAG_182830 [Trichomonas vaginalis G3]|uniref:Uncharacterized protein n=1 Tax=Trichomonas vaginalis (strain ATCC PRA-98 / G3) TaxID=412133 RepID=A2D921_TRIV3|nr:hypothetical protein TVAGG3_0529410 [Trichomonas vaginalis G3]EAY23047.1 hypothetical protein TVAG_182830 [Trichomonas vaginalis G3]KAI5519016.1 hypothetical protein TVAGG3_0529410 [Trichomonas vaginalis G3]|eukprot:XP_001584033.1 hypothetical protein [Trichomonas vaginalis G3]